VGGLGKTTAFETRGSSIYEAVLRIFGENEWIGDIGRRQTPISVMVQHPETEHTVRVQDLEKLSILDLINYRQHRRGGVRYFRPWCPAPDS